MKTLEEQCSELCGHTGADDLRYKCRIEGGDYSECCRVANELANLLLKESVVNLTWSCNREDGVYRDGIVNYLDYLSEDLQGQLLAKGLDLNQLYNDIGTRPFTWLLGNAQNDLVSQLLDSSMKNQTLDQRLVWINQTDSMVRYEFLEPRFFDGLIGSSHRSNLSLVHQTPLQLCIAKGYTTKDGRGRNMVSVTESAF
jgi:hypothetical protein